MGESPLDSLAKSAGIAPVYRDLSGTQTPTSQDTKLALLKACGWQLDNPSMIKEALAQVQAEKRSRILPEEVILESGHSHRIAIPGNVNWTVIEEGSEDPSAEGRSADDIEVPALRPGIHRLVLNQRKRSETVRLLSAPKSAPSVEQIAGQEKLWGVNLALYGLHSNRSFGLGDYEDLAAVSETLAKGGSDFCGINPVHAIGWESPHVISPYSPSHRGYLNVNHLALDKIFPVSDKTRALLSDLKSSQVNSSGKLLDYENYLRCQRTILHRLYQDFVHQAPEQQKNEFAAFAADEGAALKRFAQFEVLSSQYGADWRYWPEERELPDNKSQQEEMRFHAWLQWHASSQLRAAQNRSQAAGMKLGLYLDLAVGARRDGAEAWTDQDCMAEGVSIGAPPDHLSPAGQNWQLAAAAPGKLAANNYRAFRNIVSRNMRLCGVLRIDHILGLNRSFWIPDDGSPGGYIKHNFEALLAIVRMEAALNKTVVIGEDLGLVPKGFRQQLKNSSIYSYTVLQYEKDKSGKFRNPRSFRPQSLACFGTHDTPTLKGFVQGVDIEWWEKLGWISSDESKEASVKRREESRQLVKFGPASKMTKAAQKQRNLPHYCSAVYGALAASPAEMVSVQLDDIEDKSETQNLPSTIDEHPNWRRQSSLSVEEFQSDSRLDEMFQLMAGRSSRTPGGDKP